MKNQKIVRKVTPKLLNQNGVLDLATVCEILLKYYH